MQERKREILEKSLPVLTVDQLPKQDNGLLAFLNHELVTTLTRYVDRTGKKLSQSYPQYERLITGLQQLTTTVEVSHQAYITDTPQGEQISSRIVLHQDEGNPTQTSFMVLEIKQPDSPTAQFELLLTQHTTTYDKKTKETTDEINPLALGILVDDKKVGAIIIPSDPTTQQTTEVIDIHQLKPAPILQLAQSWIIPEIPQLQQALLHRRDVQKKTKDYQKSNFSALKGLTLTEAERVTMNLRDMLTKRFTVQTIDPDTQQPITHLAIPAVELDAIHAGLRRAFVQELQIAELTQGPLIFTDTVLNQFFDGYLLDYQVAKGKLLIDFGFSQIEAITSANGIALYHGPHILTELLAFIKQNQIPKKVSVNAISHSIQDPLGRMQELYQRMQKALQYAKDQGITVSVEFVGELAVHTTEDQLLRRLDQHASTALAKKLGVSISIVRHHSEELITQKLQQIERERLEDIYGYVDTNGKKWPYSRAIILEAMLGHTDYQTVLGSIQEKIDTFRQDPRLQGLNIPFGMLCRAAIAPHPMQRLELFMKGWEKYEEYFKSKERGILLNQHIFYRLLFDNRPETTQHMIQDVTAQTGLPIIAVAYHVHLLRGAIQLMEMSIQDEVAAEETISQADFIDDLVEVTQQETPLTLRRNIPTTPTNQLNESEQKELLEAEAIVYQHPDIPTTIDSYLDDATQAYLHQLPPPLEPEKTIELFRQQAIYIESRQTEQQTTKDIKRIARLDRLITNTRLQIIEGNLRLATALAGKYVNRGISFIDLVQEGNMGLMEAYESFDVSRRTTFATHAYYSIRGKILRAIAEKGRPIRLPTYVVGELGEISRAQAVIYQRLRKDPTVAEIATETGMSSEKIINLLSVSAPVQSLDAPRRDDDEGGTFADYVADPASSNEPERQENASTMTAARQALQIKLQALNDNERKVLSLRLGLLDGKTRTLAAVGKELQLTRERIRQIEDKAFEKLGVSPADILKRKSRKHETSEFEDEE